MQIRTLGLRVLTDLKRTLKESRGENMSAEKFVYVIYIRTTPEKLWEGADGPGVHASILGRLPPRIQLETGVTLEACDSGRARGGRG